PALLIHQYRQVSAGGLAELASQTMKLRGIGDIAGKHYEARRSHPGEESALRLAELRAGAAEDPGQHGVSSSFANSGLYQALLPQPLELGADVSRRVLVGKGAGLDAIVDALGAEIRLLKMRRQRSQDIRILGREPLPGAAGIGLRLEGGELDTVI